MRIAKFAGVAGALVAATLSVPALATSASAAPVSGTFSCSLPMFNNSKFVYTTPIDVKAERAAGSSTVTMSTTLGPMSGFTIPMDLTDVKTDVTVTSTVAGAAGTMTGSIVTPSIKSGAPVPSPAVTGSVVTSASSFDMSISALKMVAVTPAGAVDILCSTTTPIAIAGITVGDAAPATKSKVAVKVNAKKIAAVTVTVSGGASKATGKAAVVVKAGKKQVMKKNVTVKNGKAKMNTKALAKGKYTVEVAFAGTATHGASTAKKNFTVK